MRVLCVCNSGNVRSVTLGRQLKKRGAEVLCCGVDKAFQPSTIIMLANWADIIYAQKDSEGKLSRFLSDETIGSPHELLDKIDTRFDVGPDDWKYPDHPDLLRRIRDMIMNDKEWGNRNSDNA